MGSTCTMARSPSTSSTWPRRTVPSPSFSVTISANLGFCCPGGKRAEKVRGVQHSLERWHLSEGKKRHGIYLHFVHNNQRPAHSSHCSIL